MAELRVKTKLGSREVRRRLASLPKIIAGEQPDPLGLRRVFFAIVARRLYELIYEAFIIKSQGGSDSLGNSWRGLKKATIKKRTRASFVSIYPLSSRLLINRVSDRLLNSLKPGQVDGLHNYIPPQNQLYLIEFNRLILGSNLTYSKYVHKARRLWPARMKRWIEDAVETAMDYVILKFAKSLP